MKIKWNDGTITDEDPKNLTSSMTLFSLDDLVEPITGTPGSVGQVMRYEPDQDMVYVKWNEGKLAEEHGFGAYSTKDLKKRAKPIDWVNKAVDFVADPLMEMGKPPVKTFKCRNCGETVPEWKGDIYQKHPYLNGEICPACAEKVWPKKKAYLSPEHVTVGKYVENDGWFGWIVTPPDADGNLKIEMEDGSGIVDAHISKVHGTDRIPPERTASKKLAFKTETSTDKDGDPVHVISDFRLDIGNNYTNEHFTQFLLEQHPEIVDYLYNLDTPLSSTFVFKYNGKFGQHEDNFVATDFFDFMKAAERNQDRKNRFDDGDMYASKKKAKDYGDKRDHKKIDIYVDNDYKASTTWAQTCQEAKKKYLEKHKDLKPEQVKCEFAKKAFLKKATGEADQDYDTEVFDQIVEQLEEAGIPGAYHKEFDKYQGVYLKVPGVDKFWIENVTFSGAETEQTKNSPYSSAYMISPEGESVSASQGDYFQLPKDHVFEGYTLVLTDRNGKKTSKDNPTVADLPDITDVADTIQFEKGSETMHIQLAPENDPGAFAMVEVRGGVVDASDLVEYAKENLKSHASKKSEQLCPECGTPLEDVGNYKWDCPKGCLPQALEIGQIEDIYNKDASQKLGLSKFADEEQLEFPDMPQEEPKKGIEEKLNEMGWEVTPHGSTVNLERGGLKLEIWEDEIIPMEDSQELLEQFMSKNEQLTSKLQEDFEKTYEGGGWDDWRKEWMQKNLKETPGMSGNTYNEDNAFFWGDVFEYTVNEGMDKAIIMWHHGGDVRGNYGYPEMWEGDFESFLASSFHELAQGDDELENLGLSQELIEEIRNHYLREPEVESSKKASDTHTHVCPECGKKWECHKGDACREDKSALCGKCYSEKDYKSHFESSKKIAFTLKDFTDQYLYTALWSSTDESTPEGGEPMDKNYNITDIADEDYDKAKDECEDFLYKANPYLQDPNIDMEQVAHDFWLTRNRHGAGFWDGDYEEEAGKKLTEIAHSFGEVHPYVGDDGKIYISGSKKSNVTKKAEIGTCRRCKKQNVPIWRGVCDQCETEMLQRDFGSEKEARGVPLSLFNIETAPEVVETLKSSIKAPFVKAYHSTLGGDKNVSILLTISLDPKDTWANNILENSNYGKYHISNDGTVEYISGKLKLRRKTVKDVDSLIKYFNTMIENATVAPEAPKEEPKPEVSDKIDINKDYSSNPSGGESDYADMWAEPDKRSLTTGLVVKCKKTGKIGIISAL